MTATGKYHHFLPFALLYFFANTFLLPPGLLYTTLLTPVFIYWLYKEHSLTPVFKWGLLLLIPVPFHLISGMGNKAYLTSTILVVTIWIFLFTAFHAARKMGTTLENIFHRLLIINAVLVFIALLILPFGSIDGIMWYFIPISPGIPAFPRLMLLAYEPSHYGLLLSPVFIYFILKIILGKSGHPLLIGLAVAIPLVLSLSFGIIGGIFIAVSLGVIFYFRKIPRETWSYLFNLMILFALLLVAAGIIWPENPVFERIGNIFEGKDTSARGRISESFMFARDLIRKYNFWMGIGPGQIKILAHDMIINYYQYEGDFAKTVRIPNSLAEMLATYGVYGFILKLGFEIYLFFRMKIYRNLYSLTLFLFIFIYQFTGSFLTNAAEIGIWAIAFGSRFPIFELNQVEKND